MWRNGSIRIGHLGGIAVEVHFTFALVIGWAGYTGWVQYGGLTGIGFGILIVLLLFLSVLVHEFGHGLVARYFGLVVRRITMTWRSSSPSWGSPRSAVWSLARPIRWRACSLPC